MTPHENRLDETVLMIGRNIRFKGVTWKIIPKLSLLPPLICSTVRFDQELHWHSVSPAWKFPYRGLYTSYRVKSGDSKKFTLTPGKQYPCLACLLVFTQRQLWLSDCFLWQQNLPSLQESVSSCRSKLLTLSLKIVQEQTLSLKSWPHLHWERRQN